MDTWYEISVEADPEELEELLSRVAAEDLGRPLCDRDLNLAPETLSDRVRDLLRQDAHHRVFATAPQVRALLRIVAEAQGEMRIDGLQRIESGRFAFQAETYHEGSAAEIQRALEALPAGAAIEGREESEETHPEDRGVERLAQAHDYVYRTRGTAVGVPPGLLELYRQLRDLDFVRVDRLKISGPEISAAEIPG